MDEGIIKLEEAIKPVRTELYAYHWEGSGFYSTGDGHAYTLTDLRRMAPRCDLVLFEIRYRDSCEPFDWDSE